MKYVYSMFYLFVQGVFFDKNVMHA